MNAPALHGVIDKARRTWVLVLGPATYSGAKPSVLFATPPRRLLSMMELLDGVAQRRDGGRRQVGGQASMVRCIALLMLRMVR